MENKLLQKAILLARAGGREQAIPLLMHIVRVDPTNQEALNLLVELLDEDQRRAVLSAFVKESSQYQSSRLILEALNTSLYPDNIEDEGSLELPADRPATAAAVAGAVDGPVDRTAGEDPFNTWVSEDTMAEAETDAGVESSMPMLSEESDQPENPEQIDLTPEEALFSSDPSSSAPDQERDFLAELKDLAAAGSGETLQEGMPAPLDEADILPTVARDAGQAPDLDALREKEIYRFDAAPEPGEAEERPMSFAQVSAHAASKERLRKRRQRSWLIPLILFLILGVIASIAFILNNQSNGVNLAGIVPAVSSATPAVMLTTQPSATLAPSLTPTQAATSTQEASQTPAPTETLAPTVPPVAGQVMRAERDGMGLVFIPPGTFTMGWKFGDPGESPEHQVTLNAFWIDKTEVTNRLYAACVDSGACAPPNKLASYKHQDYYANPEYAEFPVVYVNWEQATAYCAWAGRRLPTEAEWEYAARGEENRVYPWGKDAPSQDLANFNHFFLDTTRVGNFPAGATPFGVLDMAGNVAEWVSDYYLESYYTRSPSENPQGPSEGVVRAFRGGSFANVGEKIRSSRRVHDDAVYNSSSLGFRCAKDAQ